MRHFSLDSERYYISAIMNNNFDLWNVFLGPGYHNRHRNETNSSTIDVLTKNCVIDYDTIACLRGTLFCFLSTVTGLLCAGRLINLHLNRHPNYYQYIVFYLALTQCFLGTAEWVVGWRLHIVLTIVYLHILQVFIVTYFYLKLAFRVKFHYHWSFGYFTTSLSTLLLTYFTAFLIIGYWFASVDWIDCYANFWVFLSVGQLTIIQFMLIACLLIISKVNSISAQESLKRSQKRGLWILVVAFEISAVVNVAYHLALFLLANEDIGGCSGVFLHKQIIYTPVRVIFKVAVELSPVWAMLYVFKPLQNIASVERQNLTVSTTNSSEGVLLDPSYVSNQTGRSWGRRNPRNSYSVPGRTLQPGVIPYRRIFRIPRRKKNQRQTTSLPASLRKMRSPPLATIPEEPGSGPSSLTTNSAQDFASPNAVFNEPLLHANETNPSNFRTLIDVVRSM